MKSQKEEKILLSDDNTPSPEISEPMSSPIDHNVVNDDNSDDDNAWYSDDEINTLLTHYMSDNQEVELLTAMLGTNWRGGNDLLENLIAFNQQRLQQIQHGQTVKDKVLIPVNLNNHHWTLLYVIYQQDAAKLPTVYYFDPLGNEIPSDISSALSHKKLFPTIQPISIGKRVQDDGYNCGPWIIEAARKIVNNGSIPDEGYDIVGARSEHKLTLTNSDDPLDSAQSTYHSPVSSGAKTDLNEISAEELIDLLTQESTVLQGVSNKKHEMLSQLPATSEPRKNQPGFVWNNRKIIKDNIRIIPKEDADEYLLCMITRERLMPGNENIDHNDPVNKIKRNVLRLADWLQSPHNASLAKNLLDLEEKHHYGYFMRDPDKGNHINTTQYLLNYYYNDIENLSILCPAINLKKGTKDFYQILYEDPLFGEAFKKAVEEKNKHALDANAIRLIVGKVGGEPAYFMKDDQGKKVIIAKNGKGLADFARDWFIKKHSCDILFTEEWRKMTKLVNKHCNSNHKAGKTSSSLFYLFAVLKRIIREYLSTSKTPDRSLHAESGLDSLSVSDSPSLIFGQKKRGFTLDNWKEFMQSLNEIMVSEKNMMKDIVLFIHRQNIRRVALRATESSDFHITRDASHKNTADYKTLEESLEKIKNVPTLKSLLKRTEVILRSSFNYNKGTERAAFFWEEFKKELFPEIKEEGKKADDYEKEKPVIISRMREAERLAKEAEQAREREKQAREEAEQGRELEKQARKEAEQRAKEAEQGREEAEQRAIREKRGRKEAELEIAKLKEQLKRQKPDKEQETNKNNSSSFFKPTN